MNIRLQVRHLLEYVLYPEARTLTIDGHELVVTRRGSVSVDDPHHEHDLSLVNIDVTRTDDELAFTHSDHLVLRATLPDSEAEYFAMIVVAYSALVPATGRTISPAPWNKSVELRGHELTPTAFHSMVGGLLLLAIFVTTLIERTLWGYQQSPLQLTLDTHVSATAVQLPLLLDVEGVIFLVGGLAAPLLCVWQARLIRRADLASARNAASWMSLDPESERLLKLAVDKANRGFARIGSRSGSALHLAFSIGVTVGLYGLIARFGPLQTWNPTHLPGKKWGGDVYHGWWANWSSHWFATLLLMLVSVNYVYYAFKTLAMGYVAAFYTGRLAKLGRGVVPDLQANIDGRWGLRDFWILVKVGYLSTLITWCGIIGLFWLWLPFRPWTFLVVFVMGCVTLGGTALPTVTAHANIVAAKNAYVKALLAQDSSYRAGTVSPMWPTANVKERIGEIWAHPNLPFRARSWLAALSTYLLVPVVVALLSVSGFPPK